MKLLSFKLRHEKSENWTPVDLNSNTCLFYSENNSTGKTTLMRAILYTFGFSIPNTELVKFEKYEFELTLTNGNQLVIYRRGNLLRIDKEEFDLPVDEKVVLSRIFKTNNPELLSNVLGTIYFDQDKGWTLLNRGTIIGANRFNIESFFRGLKGDESKESYEMVERIKFLDRKIDEYTLLENISKYRDNLMTNNPTPTPTLYQSDTKLETQIEELKIQLHDVESEIATINEVIKDNERFANYLEMKKILIENPLDPDNPIPVTRNNIVFFNDLINISTTKRNILINKRNDIRRKIAEIEAKIEKQASFIEIQSVEEALSTSIKNFEAISTGKIQVLKKEYQKERTTLSEKLEKRTKNDNQWIDKAFKIVEKYCKELNMLNDIKIDLFTSNLKSKSGAVLHKMVFIYRLTYISLLSEKLGISLPIFCDSPNGREIEQSTVEKTLEIIKRDFSNHQLICASIFRHSQTLSNPIIKEMDGTLFNPKVLFDE